MRHKHQRSSHTSGDPGNSGSTDEHVVSDEPEFLLVGRIIRPHGVRGEVAVRIETAYPERLYDLKTLYLGDSYTSRTIKRIRGHRDGVLLHLEGIADRDMAEELRGNLLYVHMEDAIPLEDGEYYLYQIEGIQVVTVDGEQLGRLTDYIETGANDVYIVTGPEGDELLIPAIPQVIKEIDLEKGIMTVELMEGLR